MQVSTEEVRTTGRDNAYDSKPFNPSGFHFYFVSRTLAKARHMSDIPPANPPYLSPSQLYSCAPAPAPRCPKKGKFAVDHAARVKSSSALNFAVNRHALTGLQTFTPAGPGNAVPITLV